MEKPLYSFSCERRLQDRDFESRKGGNGGGNLLHLAEHFFMFSLLFVRTLCLFQPLLSFVLLFFLFSLCCFDFPSPLLLFLLAIHFITLGLFLSFSFSFFELVHYHTWPFFILTCTLWWIESFYFFLFFTTTIIGCAVWWYYSIHSLYNEEMWAEQADDMVSAPERGIEYILNIYFMIRLFSINKRLW